MLKNDRTPKSPFLPPAVCLGYGQVVSIKEGKKPKSSESVCASNKKIYSNLCEFYIDTCHKGNYARLVDMSACTGQKKVVDRVLMPAAFEAADTKKFVTTLVKQKSIIMN